MPERRVPDNKACECGAILRGVKHPVDCKLFGTVCTPENPIGSCMVSSEGACAAAPVTSPSSMEPTSQPTQSDSVVLAFGIVFSGNLVVRMTGARLVS